MSVPRTAIRRVVESCLECRDIRSAYIVQSEKLVVKATKRGKPRKNENHIEIVLTIGRPNYAERKFIKLCKKAGEPFPVKKMQFKLYPKKKK